MIIFRTFVNRNGYNMQCIRGKVSRLSQIEREPKSYFRESRYLIANGKLVDI